MRLLVFFFLSLSALEAQAQLDQSQVNPQNMPIVWQCKGKYSGRTLNVRALMSDFNPLLYIESPGINQFVGNENSLQKPLWKSQGGLHLCVADDDATNRALHFLQIVDSLFSPSNKTVRGEYQRYPKYTGVSSCDGLRNAGIFDKSEYLMCDYIGAPAMITDSSYSGTLTPLSATLVKIPSIDELESIIRYQQSSNDTYVLAAGKNNTNSQTYYNIGRIDESGTDIRWFFNDEEISKTITQSIGLKPNSGIGVGFTDMAASRDGKKIWVAGWLQDTRDQKREYHLVKEFVIQIDSRGNLISSFGAKGIVFLGGAKSAWLKSANLSFGVLLTALDDGRVVVRAHESQKDRFYSTLPFPGRLLMLKGDGSEDTRFRDNVAKNAELQTALQKSSAPFIFITDRKDTILMVHYSRYGDDKIWTKLNAAGEADSKFFQPLLNTKIFNGCYPDSAVQVEKGGWIFGGDCSESTYNLVKINSDGSLATDFGTDGVANSNDWKKQSQLKISFSDFRFGSTVLTEAPDGRIIVPFMKYGELSRSEQSGHMVIKANGQIDTSFAMKGISGAGNAAAGLSSWKNSITYVGNYPIGLGQGKQVGGGARTGILVRRYNP